jgi:hypothetical protein
MSEIMHEIYNIEKEQELLKKKIAELGERKKVLTERVIKIMQEKEIKTISVKGTTYNLTEKTISKRKAESKRKQDALAILKEQGLDTNQAESIYKQLHSAFKGEALTKFIIQK